MMDYNGKNTGENRLEAENGRELAYRVIRQRIITLTYEPGTDLSDKELAAELNISRTPVREALILLSGMGMVYTKPRSGTFVAPIDITSLRLEQFKRYTMEKEAILTACTVPEPVPEARYELLLAEEAAAADGRETASRERFLEIDNSFHRLAFERIGKGENYEALLNELQHYERFRYLSLAAGVTKVIGEDHRRIYEAIRARDQVAAGYWLREHLGRYEAQIDELRSRYPGYFSPI